MLSVTAEESGASPLPRRTHGSPTALAASGSAHSQRGQYPSQQELNAPLRLPDIKKGLSYPEEGSLAAEYASRVKAKPVAQITLNDALQKGRSVGGKGEGQPQLGIGVPASQYSSNLAQGVGGAGVPNRNRYIYKTTKNSAYSRVQQNQREFRKGAEAASAHFPFPPSVFTHSVPRSKESSVSNSISFDDGGGAYSLHSLMRNDSNVFRKREVLDVIREKQSTAADEHTREIVIRAKAAQLKPSRDHLSPEELRQLAAL